MEDLSASDQKLMRDMHEAIGECLMNWASAEMQLNILFISLTGAHQMQLANGIWGQLKSFDARMSIIEELFELNAELHSFSEDLKNDAKLILQHARSCSKRRNQIAHSTLIFEHGKGAVLQPFYVFGTKRFRLSLDDVRIRGNDFNKLVAALGWLNSTGLPSLIPRKTDSLPASWKRLPDLLKELREQQAQAKEAQREQQSDLSHVKRLKRLGKWPPD